MYEFVLYEISLIDEFDLKEINLIHLEHKFMIISSNNVFINIVIVKWHIAVICEILQQSLSTDSKTRSLQKYSLINGRQTNIW